MRLSSGAGASLVAVVRNGGEVIFRAIPFQLLVCPR